MEKELKLTEYCGQNSDAILFKRQDGSKYVTLTSEQGYGNPSLDEEQLEELLETLRDL